MPVLTPTLMSLRAVSVRHGSVAALEGCDLDVAGGSTLAVIGPNGSGKSTLLRTMAGLLTPWTGTVDRTATDVALVLQSTDVDRSLPITAREVVRMARYAAAGPFRRLRADDHEIVVRSLERLDVADLADRQIHELSGGQRQRVMVAQGLAQAAEILLLDEPVTGLDVVSRHAILDVVAEERAAGRAVVITTHDLEDARLCDRVVLVATSVVAIGPPDEVLTEGPLRQAFGGRVLRLADGGVLVDDPHHEHTP